MVGPEIKLMVQEALLLNQLVEKAAARQKYGSYSERNPTKGKMINCQCGQRHRISEICRFNKGFNKGAR